MDKANEPQEDAELKALVQALHQLYDPVLEEPVPERLRARVAPPRRWRAAAIAAGWIGLGLATGVVSGWQLHAWRAGVPNGINAPSQAAVPGFVKRAAVAHAVYSPEVRHPVEVGADQEQHLVAWLSKRLGTPLRAPKLDDNGFFLVGGRLLPGENGPVAHFMYQSKQGTRITLYVRANAAGNNETAFRYAAEGSVKVFYWIDRKLGYALSSADVGTDDLLKVANAVYQQLNP
jgi:anti-sigma factor RsiW